MLNKIHDLLLELVSGKKGRKILCLALCLISAACVFAGLSLSEKYTVRDGNSSYTVNASTDDVHTLLALAGVSENGVDSLSLTDGNVLNVTRVEISDSSDRCFLSCDGICRKVCSVVKESVLPVTEVGIPETPEKKETAEVKKTEDKVEYKYETMTETIKFGYKTVKSDELEIGQSKVTEGKNGSKSVTYRIKYVNGKRVSKEVYEEKITKAPVDQIETVGTKRRASEAVMTSDDVKCVSTLVPSSPIELDADGRPVNYVKTYEGKGSAYASGSLCATGVRCQPGYVAVNPKQIPYGTKMYIVSADGKYNYGYAVAADTGGFATNGSGRIVDLRFNTESECIKFGVRKVIIYILE